MNKTPLCILDHNKTIELHIEKMAVYLQSKIIEAFDQQNQVFYVFFYNDQYLTYVKPTRLKRGSHIEHALTKGLIVHPTHPIIHSLLTSQQPLKKRTFNQLMKKIECTYSPQEVALIATFFESFVSKKNLFTFIQSIFYDFRRSGKMFSSYRIIRILMDFCPNHSWVKGISNDLDFIKYGKLYHQLSDELFEKDPLFMEKALYMQKDNEQHFQRLVNLLTKQARWLDLTALYIQNVIESHNSNYSIFIQPIEQHFNEEEMVVILEDLSDQISDIPELQQDLLERYLKLQKPEKVMNVLTRFDLTLNSSQASAFEKMVEEINFDTAIPTTKLNSFLVPLFKVNPIKADKLLQKCITNLLKEHNIMSIKEWLTPLQHTKQAIPILEKIDHIQKLADDPDQQLQLGQLYYQFKQYDQAIDCFCWEMELNAHDPKPVQWLSKLYHEMGMEQEHKAYRQLYIDMQKRA